MSDLGQERRLRQLEQRVRELELRMGISPAEPMPVPPPPVQPPPLPPLELTLEEEPTPVPPIVPPEPPIDTQADFAAAARQEAAAPIKTFGPQAMEQTIGLKWAGWVGAVVLVFGAALGVQFAYENHWFGHVPPALRLATIFAVGLELIGAGEWVFRRVNVISAASVFGAGVATLFVGAYAGYAYFDLYSRSSSMSLMAVSTLIGAAVAMRGNLVSIAILSLVGANLAPLLVATDNAPVGPFLFYLLMMQTVALFLATWGRGGKWWTLRGTSLVPTIFWMLGVLVSSHRHESVVLVFMLAYAVLYHAELIVATLRKANDAATETIGTAFALAVTAAITLGVLSYFADASDTVRASWVAALAMASVALGLVLPNAHPSLRRLGLSHRIAAAGLLVLIVPIATSGVRVEVGWMLLAVVFAVAWALTGSRVSRLAAPVTWALGLARLALAAVDTGTGSTWLTLGETAIGSTAVLAWMFAVAGHAIAPLLKSRSDEPQSHWAAVGGLLAMVAGMVWLLGSIYGLPPAGATLWIVAYAWLLVAADTAGIGPGLAEQASCALLLATIKWAAVDTLTARLSPQWTQTRPLWNALMGNGLLVAASLAAFYRVRREALWKVLRKETGAEPAAAPFLMAALVIALMTLGFSFEIDRAVAQATSGGWTYPLDPWVVRQLAWTMFWSTSVMLLILAAGILTAGPLRARWSHYAWIAGGLLAAKYVVVDTLWQFVETDMRGGQLLFLPWMAGCAVVAALFMARRLASDESREGGDLRWRVGMLVTLLIAWMGTLEIDRFVLRMHLPEESFGLAWHLKNIGWTTWWSAVAGGAMMIWWWRDRRGDAEELARQPWAKELPQLTIAIALKYLIVDAILWRLLHNPPAGWRVIVNPDVLAAAMVVGVVVLPCRLVKSRADKLRSVAGTVAVPLLLVCGTIELDRAFYLPAVRAALNNAELAEQVALSIWWSLFAVAALAVGFWRHVAALRYAALGLLAATLLKVVVVDLSQVGYGYRVLSFLGLGVLLMGTSIMYGKVSPKLLGQIKG